METEQLLWGHLSSKKKKKEERIKIKYGNWILELSDES